MVWQMQSTAAGATMEAHDTGSGHYGSIGGGMTGEGDWGREVSHGVSAFPANKTTGNTPDSLLCLQYSCTIKEGL